MQLSSATLRSDWEYSGLSRLRLYPMVSEECLCSALLLYVNWQECKKYEGPSSRALQYDTLGMGKTLDPLKCLVRPSHLKAQGWLVVPWNRRRGFGSPWNHWGCSTVHQRRWFGAETDLLFISRCEGFGCNCDLNESVDWINVRDDYFSKKLHLNYSAVARKYDCLWFVDPSEYWLKDCSHTVQCDTASRWTQRFPETVRRAILHSISQLCHTVVPGSGVVSRLAELTIADALAVLLCLILQLRAVRSLADKAHLLLTTVAKCLLLAMVSLVATAQEHIHMSITTNLRIFSTGLGVLVTMPKQLGLWINDLWFFSSISEKGIEPALANIASFQGNESDWSQIDLEDPIFYTLVVPKEIIIFGIEESMQGHRTRASVWLVIARESRTVEFK